MRHRSRLELLVALLALTSCSSSAKLRSCLDGQEMLGLAPTGAVTLDGFSLQRSTSSGRFQTDAGLDFDVTVGEVAAIDAQSEECVVAAGTVTLTVRDPFSGVTTTIAATSP